MIMTGPISGKSKDDARNASFVAFVADDLSAQELTRFVKNTLIPNAHIGRGGIDAAIAHLGKAEKSPQSLIVDISGIDLPLLALNRLAEACGPSVKVYVLGDQNEVRLYRDLLQAGVQDYLVKPLTINSLRGALGDQDGQSVRKVRTGKVIAVTGTRGGAGVTCVAGHLARHLSEGEGRRRVVYVDMDFYGSTATTLLGMTANHALSEVLQNIDRIDPQFLDRTLINKDGRLFMLAANLGYSEPFAAGTGSVGLLMDVLSEHFHYVVVDLAEPGGVVANEVFSHADMACVLSDRSVHSARVLTRLVLHIEARPNAPALYAVINNSRAPARGRVDAREFAQAVSYPIAMEIAYDGRAPALAEDLGEPLPAGGELAKAVARLARLLTGEAAQGAGAASKVARWLRRTA